MESDTSVVNLIHMLNDNVNGLRKELLDALAEHEKTEMEEIDRIHEELRELQGWKWRMVVAFAVAIALGLVRINNWESITFGG